MSNCTGCHNAFGDNPNPHAKECTVCIRNPKYPTMKMPEKATIDGIEVTVPQDLYIARDRKNLEEKRMMKKLQAMLANLLLKRKKKPDPMPSIPWNPRPEHKPWEWYWDYVKHAVK